METIGGKEYRNEACSKENHVTERNVKQICLSDPVGRVSRLQCPESYILYRFVIPAEAGIHVSTVPDSHVSAGLFRCGPPVSADGYCVERASSSFMRRAFFMALAM